MKTKTDLKQKLKQIDHKSYKLYKDLKGVYQMDRFLLAIDHVQGDPFATPSRVRVIVDNETNFPAHLFDKRVKKIALEDYLLRGVHQFLRSSSGKSSGRTGSGKSGLITICPVGQEVLERTAVLIGKKQIEVRMEIGFPAFGRTIASAGLEQIFFEKLPRLVQQVFSYEAQQHAKIKKVLALAEDQHAIRTELEHRNLVAFVADDSILPRESGVSARPLKNAVPFHSPESMAVTLTLPHSGEMRGMGIPKGVTLIAGGGYHGKSTLLKALVSGVYNHIAGDGREYVVTIDDAVKIRAEEGRCIHGEDISLFINHLPSRTDTTCFVTENASGSTSQAANTVEALSLGSRLLLIDEDTSATNFMVRDEKMARLVPASSEPITPFIQCIQSLSADCGVSSILVVGSSGEYLSVADRVVQMDCYEAKDVSARARELASPYQGISVKLSPFIKKQVRGMQIEKVKAQGEDSVLLDKERIDLRYFDQLTDSGQTAALAYLMQYALEHFTEKSGSRRTALDIADLLYKKIEQDGFLSVIPSYYGTGAPVLPRKAEFLFCMLRYRKL